MLLVVLEVDDVGDAELGGEGGHRPLRTFSRGVQAQITIVSLGVAAPLLELRGELVVGDALEARLADPRDPLPGRRSPASVTSQPASVSSLAKWKAWIALLTSNGPK